MAEATVKFTFDVTEEKGDTTDDILTVAEGVAYDYLVRKTIDVAHYTVSVETDYGDRKTGHGLDA